MKIFFYNWYRDDLSISTMSLDNKYPDSLFTLSVCKKYRKKMKVGGSEEDPYEQAGSFRDRRVLRAW